jgi:hypothetical protein
MRRAEGVVISNLGSFSMNTGIDFRMVCGDCGSLAIKIENPESASREAIIYCGDLRRCTRDHGCAKRLGRSTKWADCAAHERRLPPVKGRSKKPKVLCEISERYRELQSLRRKVQMAESSWRVTPPNMLDSPNGLPKIEWD